MQYDIYAYYSQWPFLTFFMVDNGFADRLALAMRDKRVTQAALAEALQVSQSTVSRWLAGSVPRKLVLVGIATFLDVRLDWLREGKGAAAFFSAFTLMSDVVSFADVKGKSADERRKLVDLIFETQRNGFGTRVHLLRRRLGRGVNAFASCCGLTPSYVSRIESGSRSNPSIATVDKIMAAFPVTRRWLTTGEPPILVPLDYRPTFEDDTVKKLMEMENEEHERRRSMFQAEARKVASNLSVDTASLAKMIEETKEGAANDELTRMRRDFLVDILTARMAIESEKKSENSR